MNTKDELKQLEEQHYEMFTRIYDLRQQVQQELAAHILEGDYLNTVTWNLIIKEQTNPLLSVAAGPIPDEFYSWFENEHDSLDLTPDITLYKDDSWFSLNGSLDALMNFAIGQGLVVECPKLKFEIQRLENKLSGLKKLLTKVEGALNG